jgi:hypothetical protein
MDRHSVKGMTALLGAALALAVWGCGGSHPTYLAYDGGGGGQRDVQRDGEHDARPDGESEGGSPQDAGARQDAQDDADIGDGGEGHTPIVLITEPIDGTSLRDSLTFTFTVTDQWDGLKAVRPEVTIDGQPITTSIPVPNTGDTSYQASGGPIDLTPFVPGPHTLFVRAWDVGDVKGEATAVFYVDRTGPTLTPDGPLPGELVTGTVTFTVKVEDPAGYDPDSVSLEIREMGKAVALPLYQVGSSDRFTNTYAVNLLWTDMMRPEIMWRATDLLGNESQLSYLIAVDNTGPRITLVSPPVYVYKVESGVRKCARPVDPLANVQGSYRAGDDQEVGQAVFLRARVEDLGNWVTDAVVVPAASVDENSVKLYLRPLDSTPLVMASGGICQSINPNLVEVAALSEPADPTQVLVVKLVAIPLQAALDYRLFSDDTYTTGFCTPGIPDTDPPDPLCINVSEESQFRYVLNQPCCSGESAIYGLEPIVAGDRYYCEGVQFDSRQLPDGWFCAAVTARDRLGNLGVSRPIRMCLSKNHTGNCGTPPAMECSSPAGCEIQHPYGVTRTRARQ